MTQDHEPSDIPVPLKKRIEHKYYPLLFLPLVFICVLVGCQIQKTMEPAAVTQTQSSTPQTSGTVVAGTSTVVATTETPTEKTLVIWLPQQLDPNADTPTGRLIKSRLDLYHQENPDWVVSVRLKSMGGRGSLLDSLTNASLAAPAALPAVIALPSTDLETAALKGLLLPFNDEMRTTLGGDWLPYASNLGVVQQKTFGVPFAGDALALVYHPLLTPYPPSTWQELSLQSSPVYFPASDINADVILSIYLAAGGSLLDEGGKATLDPTALQKTFAILDAGVRTNAFPTWLIQYANFQDAYTAFSEKSSGYAVVWVSQYLQSPLDNTAVTALPAFSSTTVSFSRGWVWCIPDSSKQAGDKAYELVQFLSDPDFLNSLDQAAGYLPVNKSGLATLTNASDMQKIIASAQQLPNMDTFTNISPLLETATVNVIQQKVAYPQAVQDTLSHFKQ